MSLPRALLAASFIYASIYIAYMRHEYTRTMSAVDDSPILLIHYIGRASLSVGLDDRRSRKESSSPE